MAGLASLLGEGGGPLSEGQRQRIGLARALFGRPVLVVLDESDARLYVVSEQALARAIAELKEGGTTVAGYDPGG